MTNISISQWNDYLEKWKVDSLYKLKNDSSSIKFPYKVGEVVLTYQPSNDGYAKKYAPYRYYRFVLEFVMNGNHINFIYDCFVY